jgi:hypothetical protein
MGGSQSEVSVLTDGAAESRRTVTAAPEGRVALVFPYVRTRAATKLPLPPLGLAGWPLS